MPVLQKKVIEYLASFDEHIKDFEIEKLPHDADSKEETYKISSLHKKIDSDTFAVHSAKYGVGRNIENVCFVSGTAGCFGERKCIFY